MTSDLERDLQLALREGVGHVTPDRLRHDGTTSQAAPAARRNRWAASGPILTAACVAVLALAATLVATRHDGGTPTASGRTGSPTSLVGTSWQLASVQHGNAVTPIPAGLGAGVTFERGGVLSAQDGTNVHRGTFGFSGAQTMQVQGGAVTAAGYAGHDPGRLAAISGIGAMFRTADGASTRHPVAVHRAGDALTLTANGYTLTFQRPVPVATSSSATASGEQHPAR